MLADELEVATVRFVGRVENVADDRKGARQDVDQDIEDHSKQNYARHTSAQRERHESYRARAGHCVADAGKQDADDRVSPNRKSVPGMRKRSSSKVTSSSAHRLSFETERSGSTMPEL